MARYVELRRHTDADGDVLTPEGVRAATEIGARLRGGYDLLVSTGAQRATQTLACFLAARGERVAGGVVVEAGLRSGREDRWREAYEQAGSGALEALRSADPELAKSTRQPGVRRSDECSTRSPTGDGPWSSGTARPTRRPCSGSPARSSARSPRERASYSSPTIRVIGWRLWTEAATPSRGPKRIRVGS
jgi:hypothetical protein